MFGYRSGVKQEHINEMRRLHESGLSVDEISEQMKVVRACVESFALKFNREREKNNVPPKVAVVERPQELEANPVEVDDVIEPEPEIEEEPVAVRVKRKPGRPPSQRIPESMAQ